MKRIELSEIKEIIKSNSTIAIGGFTINRKPMAIINEIVNSEIKDLHLYLLAGAIDVDKLVGKTNKISAAYVGYEGLGLSNATRNAVETGRVIFEDLTEILYYYRLKAGSKEVPYLLTESIVNTDIININSGCSLIKDNFGKTKCKIEVINPDFCLIHAQKADKEGNILIDEPDFCEKEMAKASKISIFSVEEIGKIAKEKITIPKEDVDYLIISKNGASPTGCKNYYLPNINKIIKFIKNE